MTITALHIALGQSSGPLTLGLVAAACAAGTAEVEELDWKETLPLSLDQVGGERREKEQFELAKDVAAMANTRGGLIVYGVDEALAGSSDPHELVGVQRPVGFDYGQRIRQVVNALVHPPVAGLREHWLGSEDSDGPVVLVLEVPESLDRPHLVRPRDAKDRGLFAAPWRDGSHTMWMGDRQIEDAYRARIRGRGDREDELARHVAELERVVDAARPAAWIVAVAMPEAPVRRTRAELDGVVLEILDQAWKFRRSTVTYDFDDYSGPGDLLRTRPRRSLRRFRQHGSFAAQDRILQAVAEVHRDGTAALAWTRDGFFSPTDIAPSAIAVDDLQRFGIDLLGLIEATATGLAVRGSYVVQWQIVGGGTLFKHPFKGQHGPPEVLPSFVPLVGTVRVGQGHDVAAADLVELVEDAVSQSGGRSDLSVEVLRRVRAPFS